MKKEILLIATLLFSMILFAQKEYYINSDGEEVLKHKALYKRVVERIEKSHYKVSDYYLDGSIQMTGYYSDKKLTIEKDTFTYYFISGRIESKVGYNDKGRNGTYESYYFKGNKSSLGNYKDGKKEGKWLSWDFNGKLESEKEYANGKPTNTWIWYDSLGNQKLKIEQATEAKINSLSSPPKLKNGMTIHEYFSTIEYPEEILADNKIGVTHLEFLIDTNGNVKDVEVIIHSDERLSDVVVEHAYNMPECIPRKNTNKKTETRIIIPLSFRTSDKYPNLTDTQKAKQYYNSALIAAQQKNYGVATGRLLHAMLYNPSDVDINYLLGTMWFQLEEYPKACKYWTLAYTMQPDKLDEEKKRFCEIIK